MDDDVTDEVMVVVIGFWGCDYAAINFCSVVSGAIADLIIKVCSKIKRIIDIVLDFEFMGVFFF